MSESSIPAPVSAVVDAINDGDTDAFVGAFTPDGFVNDWGRVLNGPDGIRSWAESDAIGMNARMTVLTAETQGDTTTLRFEWRSQKFNGESDAIVVVENGLVKSFTIPPH
ncbi:nuclear transport factor 2 family protein [Phytoactinopolyspora mesophila]|uniref:Nuclear transport factor 2 family protein n=1 Tax=Phytoactinopolyspora mesophila TaxID=2650750 RepID=A0A7K3MAC4_9ACTN|nr:nuclear transport factor 2 family protein [Phytoactinopolyspora mesophila]NDL60243.1 nuclear transport factor 2 family protein [Phytoactinopolyspora mesophila]